MSEFSREIREFLAVPDAERRLGPYRCREVVDKTGTAPVFKAVEEHGGLALREVAVKVFTISKEKGPRVLQEARALCRVQHPNVIRFHTITTDPKRGLMGLVMEFADGISVEKELESVPAADPRRIALAVEIGIAIASALHAAHEAGVVHCNVKPSNIMFTEGSHKLINFGIASALDAADDEAESSARATLNEITPDEIGLRASLVLVKDEAAPLVGTIGYIDPVCIATTSPPVAASDLYSLGATLYQCLAGTVPALARGRVDEKVLDGEVPAPPLAEVAPYVPAELAKLVDGLLAPRRESRPRSADAVRRSFERIRSTLAGRTRALPPEERGPFPGLDRYEVTDRDAFFGRSAEIAGILELGRTRGLVGVVGLSGSGKSSIMRAGLLPAIEEGALGGWPTKYRSVLITPGADLMAALGEGLSKVLESPLARHPEAILEQLSADVDAKGEGIVILVDQLEELVIKHDPTRDDARRHALDLLSRLAEAPVGIRVIVAVRSDLLDAVLAIDPHFARALSRGIQHLGPLTATDWEEVLDQSFDIYGYRFETPDLRREVLAEIKDLETAMTLVQFGLMRLWAQRDAKQKVVPREALIGKGGMKGALAEHADLAVLELKLPREKLREVLLAMTTPEGTRAHVPLEDLVAKFGSDCKEGIFALTKARLVVSEPAGFTFTHDAVLREWPLMRRWLEEARDDRLLSAQLERDATRFRDSRDATELWRKARLAAALDLWKRDLPLSETAKDFLRAAHRASERAQILRLTSAVLFVLLIVGGSLFYAKLKSDSAAQARRDADALSAALAEVKRLKQEAEENALEAAASAKLLEQLQKQMAEERATYGANVQAAVKKVATATNLDTAQKAAADLKAPAPAHNRVVPLPLDTGGSPSVGGTFDHAAIERVVNTRKAGVKRTCFERSASRAPTTKVTASITIAPSGAVQNVTTTGDDPLVAKCIEQQLRSWSFPPPGEVKEVQIPFAFLRQ